MMKIYLLLALVAIATAEWQVKDPFGSPQQKPPNLKFGDMLLTPFQQQALKSGKDMGARNGYAAESDTNLRWKDAVIPYKIDCSLENLEDAVDAITKAMKEWEAKTCIRFVKHTNEKYFLNFFRNTHCWGNIGQTSYTQISVGHGCEYQHVMTHEIGHVVGFYHEQNRKDRDDWVTVHWENIGQFKDAFDIVKNTDSLGVPYDYESIMHYPWNAFSSNGKNTMSPKKDTKGKIPYVELSAADINQTSLMYNCPAVEKKRKNARNKRHIGDLVTKRSNAERTDCIDDNKYCSDWAKVGYCSDDPYTQQHCRMSCKAPSCKNSDCKNQHKDCDVWAKWGHCEKNPTVMKECQKSCNPVCKSDVKPTQPPTQPPPTAPSGKKCVDGYADCPEWAHWGHCKLNPTVMKECQKSCNPDCNGGVLPTLPPATRPPPTSKPNVDREYLGKGKLCIDGHKECANWAKTGECESNPGWMKKNCMKSCKVKNCDPIGLRPRGSCANPLGLSWDGTPNFKIPDSAFYSPANLSPGGGWQASAKNARLYFEDDYTNKRIGSWCAASHDQANSKDGYVQVDLQKQVKITYIATQGRDKYFERVSRFKIQYSSNGSTYKTYQVNGVDKIFDGNCDHVTPVLNKFTNPITARYIRYIPVEWNFPCVRMEFYGC